MRKQKGSFCRQMLALLMSAMLFATSVPEINLGAAETSKTVVETVVSTELPEEETTRVEVFSEDGKIEQKDVAVDDFEDVPFNESSIAELFENSVQSAVQEDNYPLDASKQMVEQIADQLNFQYRDLINNGPDSDNFCILIAGDGYTAGEQEKFLQTAQRIADYFLTKSPFNESAIRAKINIRAVNVISNQTGVSMDPNNPYDTFFKSTFWNGGIERLICIHDNAALERVIRQYMPECNVPIVVGNSTVYGGSGGSVCVLSAHEASPEIAVHEFGHTGGGLADEYWELTTDAGNRYEAPNRTANSNPSTCKWSDLINVNGVGLYEFEEAAGWYRPHQNCEMRYLNAEFCEVCKRQLRNVIGNVVNNKVGDNVVISTADQLLDYASKVSAGAKTYGKKVTLANSITLSNSTNFPVMWNFDGTFDGNGHTIYNVKINSGSGSSGFIGTLGTDGLVKNLCLSNVNVNSSGYYMGGLVGNCKGTILQCGVSGTVTGDNGAGGIAGHIESGLIQDCYNKATIRGNSQVAGGVVGWADGGTVNNCWSVGSVSDGANTWYGGVCGYRANGTISNSYYLSGSGRGDYGGSAKSSSEFSNGSVTNSLNSVSNVWKQGDGYPTFKYTSVNVGEQTTTQKPNTGNGPEEVFGHLISATTPGIIDVVWGAATNGQTYNVYVDGNIATDSTGAKLQNVICAAYRIPSSAGNHTVKITSVLNGQESAGVTGTVTVTGSAEVTTTTAVSMDGYTTAGGNWNDLNYWSVYFAQDWAGNPTGGYKDGGSYSNFAVKISTASNAEWGVQMKTQPITVTEGKKYTCKINVDSNMATSSNIRIKDDISGTEKLQTLTAGSNTFVLEFTSSNTAQIFFDLGLAPAGLEFKVTSFSLEKEEETTTVPETTTEEPTTRTFDAYATIEAEHFASNQGGVIDTNSNASGGHNIGGVNNGVTMRYDNVRFGESAKGITLCYSSPSGIANGNAEIYLGSMDNKVGTITLSNNSTVWESYGMTTGELDVEIPAGSHTIYVKYVTTSTQYYVANVDYFFFVRASEFVEETTTEPETATTITTIEGGIEVNGYQISTTTKGMRTIYSVDSEINGKDVVASGVVYSLADYASASELYVGSSSKYVCSYQSTSAGVMSVDMSESDIATSYAMTMKFATTEADEFTAKWRVCAYAKLSDGTYVYTKAYEYSIYDIADYLHQGCKMNTQTAHDYLYTGILSIVNPAYKKKDFNWDNTIVGA